MNINYVTLFWAHHFETSTLQLPMKVAAHSVVSRPSYSAYFHGGGEPNYKYISHSRKNNNLSPLAQCQDRQVIYSARPARRNDDSNFILL
jgi:hypothetical protein